MPEGIADPDIFVTVPKAIQLAKLPEATIRAAINDGEIPVITSGKSKKRYLVQIRELWNWRKRRNRRINEQQKESGKPSVGFTTDADNGAASLRRRAGITSRKARRV